MTAWILVFRPPDARDEMEIVSGEDPHRPPGASGAQGGYEYIILASTSFDITAESANKDDESEGSPD
jgi:hypothetical protein